MAGSKCKQNSSFQKIRYLPGDSKRKLELFFMTASIKESNNLFIGNR